jgi:hypothetical protein
MDSCLRWELAGECVVETMVLIYHILDVYYLVKFGRLFPRTFDATGTLGRTNLSNSVTFSEHERKRYQIGYQHVTSHENLKWGLGNTVMQVVW